MNLDLNRRQWKRSKFGDVVKNVNESVKDPSVDGIGRTIAMEHLDPGELQIKRWGAIADGTTFTRRVRPGQTLFGKRRAYQRKAAYAEFDAICSGDILVFEAVESRLLPELLPFLVQSDGFYATAIGTSAGSLSPRTNWKDLSAYEFDLPSLEQQQRIADLLWAILNNLSASQLLFENLSMLRGARFRAELEEGQRNAGWGSKTVSNVVVSGPTNGKSSPANDEQRGIPTLSISAVRQGRVEGGTAVKYVDMSRPDVSSFVLQDDDFLVVRGNGNKRLTGLGGLVRGGLPAGCIFPDLLIRLRFDPEQIHPEFATEQWNSTPSHHTLLRNAKSTNGIWKINGKDIKQHRLVVPPVEEQLRILADMGDLQEAQMKLSAEISALQTLRRLVLTEAFSL